MDQNQGPHKKLPRICKIIVSDIAPNFLTCFYMQQTESNDQKMIKNTVLMEKFTLEAYQNINGRMGCDSGMSCPLIKGKPCFVLPEIQS